MNAAKRQNFLSGPAAVVGGAFWTGCTVVMATRPPGVTEGDYRHTDDLGPFVLASLVLFAISLAGLYTRRTGRSGLLGRAGLVAGFAGVTAIVAGSTAQLIGSTDYSLTPWFLLPGALFFIGGVVLTAIASLRGGVLPGWVGGLLIGATLLMLLFNSEDNRAWLAVPLGLAWIVVGFVPAFDRRPNLQRVTRRVAKAI